MCKKFFKNLGISQKIITVVLATSFIAQISTGILAFSSIIKLSNQSQTEASSLGTSTAKKSEESLKVQAESYLTEIATSTAEASDNILKNIDNTVNSLSSSMEDIYQNPNKFNGHNIAIPETTTPHTRTDKNGGSEKFYVADPQNTSKNQELVLAYDFGEYSSENFQKIYKTNIEEWEKLSTENRKIIQQNKIVVSNNLLPSEIKNEVYIISNILHDVQSIYESNPTISSIYLGTKSGISYHYSPSNSSERYNPTTRSWYIDAVNNAKNNSTVWQSTYIGKSDNTPCITCSKAFKDSAGNILGVIAIDMYLDNINKYILETNIGNLGHIFITDKNGKIVMHPEYQPNEQGVYPQDFDLEPLKNSSDSESYKNVINNMKNNKTGIETASINNNDYYIAYSPINTTGWSLGATSDIQKISAPATETYNFIENSTINAQNSIRQDLIKTALEFFIIFIACSLITYILGVKFSNDVFKPIKKLRNQAQIIGEGDFDSRIKIESHDELGDLSNTFNKMANNLKTYTENLEITTREKEKIHSELMIAKKIQHSMLPCIFPAFPERKDFDIYAIMDPAKEVGGDFYDFFFVDKENFALVISDVSGKGVSAALFMVIAKILIKNQLQMGDEPDKVLEIVNNRLCENNEAGMFVTSFIGIINIKTGKFTYANAGHNPPLIYKKSLDKYEFIEKPHGFVLGGMPNQKFSQSETFLSPEDILFLYTDGVTEAMNSKNKLFGTKKLEEILKSPKIKKLNVKDIIINLRNEIEKFSENTERTDDITMLAFKSFDIPNRKNFPNK